MRADNNGDAIKSSRRELEMNGSDVLEDRGDDKANRYHWKCTPCWSPLKIMLTGNDAASSWSIKWNADN
jgi:hypothetical protein